jgi:hypothetical protein
VVGNIIWAKKATYTITTVIAPAAGGTNPLPIIWQGYNSTRGDLVATSPSTNAPLITTATNSTNILSGATSNQTSTYYFNINFSNTAVTRAAFGNNGTNVAFGTMVACKFTGFSGMTSGGSPGIIFENCEFASFTGAVFSTTSGLGLLFDGCWVHDGTDFVTTGNGNGINNPVVITDCIVSNMSGWVVNSVETFNTIFQIEACSVYKCAGGFVQVAATNSSTNYNRIMLKNNVVWGVTTSKIVKNNDTNGRTQLFTFASNAYGGPTTPYTNITAPSSDLTITADPYTASGSNDYSLNNIVGAGASCRAAGFPGRLGSSTGYVDLGAIQHADPVGGGGTTVIINQTTNRYLTEEDYAASV